MEQLRTEAEKYFNNKYPEAESPYKESAIDMLIDFHAQQSKEREWISVKDRLPNAFDSDENGKVLIFRNNNDSQSTMPKSIHPFQMVKHCDKDTFWMPLPKNPL